MASKEEKNANKSKLVETFKNCAKFKNNATTTAIWTLSTTISMASNIVTSSASFAFCTAILALCTGIYAQQAVSDYNKYQKDKTAENPEQGEQENPDNKSTQKEQTTSIKYRMNEPKHGNRKNFPRAYLK